MKHGGGILFHFEMFFGLSLNLANSKGVVRTPQPTVLPVHEAFAVYRFLYDKRENLEKYLIR